LDLWREHRLQIKVRLLTISFFCSQGKDLTSLTWDLYHLLVSIMEINVHGVEVHIKEYFLADELITWISVLSGIIMCNFFFISQTLMRNLSQSNS
jgi:hypothetical protein